MKPHVPLLLYGLLAGEVATAVPITGSVGPARHVVVDDPMFMRPVNWPLPAQGPPRQSNMTATTLLTAPYKKKRSIETTYAEHDTYINRFFPYWKTVEVSPFRQPAEEQPAEEQPVEKQPVEKQSAETQFAEEQSADQKPAEKQSADKKPAEKKPADKKPADKKPAEKKPAEKKPADKKPAEKKPADKKPADKKPDGKKANSDPAAATPTKKPSPGSERVTKNGPFKVVSADINNPSANKQTDCSSATATTTKKNDDSTPTGSSSTFKKTEDDNDNNNNGNNINSGSTVYKSNIANSTVDDSVINNSTVVDSRVLDSTVSDANILHSTVVDDVVIDSSTLEDTTVAGQSAVTEGSTLSGSDVLGGSAVAGGSTVVDSNILDGASVVDGSNVIGESVVGEGSAVAGESNVFDGSVVTRRDGLVAKEKRKMPWMPDSVKIVMCIFSPIIGCAMAAASEMNYPGERQKRQLVDDGGSGSGSGSGSSAVTLAKRMKSTSEMTGMVMVCVFMPFLCPIYGDGRGKKRQLLADGGSSSSSSAVVSSLDKRNKGLEAMPVGAKVAVCIIFVWLCPVAVMSSGEDPDGPGPDKRELVQDGSSNGSSSISISDIDMPIMPIMAKRGGPKKLSKPARTTLCVLFPYICPVVWRRGLDVDDPASSQISSSDSSSNNAIAPLGKRALRQCGAPLPWWCSNVTKRATTTHLPAVADDAAAAEGSIKLLDKRKWTPAKFILCRLLFIFCFTDLGTRDLAHAHHAAVDDEANNNNNNTTTVVAMKRSPQDPWVATQVTEYLDKLVKNEADAPPEVRVLPDVEPPDEEVDKKRRKTKRSAVELDVTVGGTNVAHIAAETEGKKGLLQVATDFIMRVVLGQVPSDPIVESKKKEDGGDARKKEKREEESSYSPPAPPPAEGTEVAAVAKRKFSWGNAIGIIAGSTVIIEHFKKPIEAFIDGLGELLDMKKRSVPPPERRDVAAVEDRNANTNTDPTAPSGDGDDDGDGNSKVSEVSEAVGSLIDGINGKRSSVPGGAAEEEESTMTKRAAGHDRRATEFFKPLLDFPGHGHHRVKEFNIPAHAPGHGYHRASKFYMPPLFPGLPLSPKN